MIDTVDEKEIRLYLSYYHEGNYKELGGYPPKELRVNYKAVIDQIAEEKREA